ncbi:MAG: PD-(D/E)XK nuclease family protein [Chloroflexi bacterium]|nr:PD-(D/E)XK nuclease family protein [Chloroflexota bacterium]
MPIDLLLAPAAAGKTAHCITRIQTLRRDNPLATIWVVAPNSANVTAFRRRLAHADGAIGVHLGTFYTLYEELLAQAGQLVARLDEPIIFRLLRDLAVELHTAGALHFFANIHNKPGFWRILHASIQELKRARITPEKFADTVRGRGARLEELARLYLAYQQRLLASDWADGEGQGWLAALALENDANLARGWRLLVVDGFDEFNPTQLEVLRLLATRTDETLVTLTGDSRERLAHRRFLRARTAIESTLAPGLAVPSSSTRPATPLTYLESALFEPTPPPRSKSGESDAIEFIEAPNRAEEIRAALRWLKARIVRDHFAPGEVALLARNSEPYRAFIEEIAAEFGLPIFLREGANLATNPAVAALMNLLALSAQDFPRRLVVEAWRSPYANWSAQRILPGDAERLDAAARWGQVVAGVAQWQDTLTRLAAARRDDDAAEREEEPSLTAPTGAIAAALWQKFQAFAARLTPPTAATLREHVAWLEELIGDDPVLLTEYARESDASLRVVHCARNHAATRERDVAALREFKNVLRALVFAEAAFGAARPITFAEFWTELRGAVEATAYCARPPDETETILAASVLSARGLSFRAVALVGLAEGEFPRAATEDPLLPETDRAALELAPRLSGDEVTIFYEAATRAREKLLLTRPYLADDGQPWEASSYWEHVRQLMKVAPARSEDALSPENAASLAELLTLLPQSPLPAFGEFYRERGEAVRHGASVLSARMADEARGEFEGDLSALHARLTQDFPATRPWSASRLETFGTCPYAFFTAYALGLEPRPPAQAGYDVRQLGTMYHAILETLYRDASDQTNLDALLAALPDIARKIFDDAPATYGFRPTELWQQQRAELERILAETVRALNEASAGWRPAHFELAFGKGENAPLTLCDENGEQIQMRGYIDRVDVNDAGELRVLDYKAGSSPISKKDLDDGKRLQLALYALALRDALQIGEPVAGLYWHIGAAKASSLKLEKYPGGIGAAFETATTHALAHAARVRRGDFAPHVPEGGCPAWCAATAFCWRYKPKK